MLCYIIVCLYYIYIIIYYTVIIYYIILYYIILYCIILYYIILYYIIHDIVIYYNIYDILYYIVSYNIYIYYIIYYILYIIYYILHIIYILYIIYNIYYLRAAALAADPGRMVNEWNQIGINILRCFALLGFPLFHMYIFMQYINIFDKIFWYSKKTHPPNPFTPLSSSSTTSTRVWVLSSWNYSFY